MVRAFDVWSVSMQPWVRGGPGGSGVSFLWKLVRFLPASTLHPPTSLRPPGARPAAPSSAALRPFG